MRILSLQPFLKSYGISPFAGGKDKAAIEICRFLIKTGHQVDILPMPWGVEVVANEPFLKDTTLLFPPDDLCLRALPTQIPLSSNELQKLIWRVLRSRRFWKEPWATFNLEYSCVLGSKERAFKSALLRYKYDLILVHQSGSDISLVAKQLGNTVPIGMIHHSSGLGRYSDFYDHVVFVSQYQRDSAIRICPSLAQNSRVVHYWIGEEFLAEFGTKAPTEIAFVGLLDNDRKGLDLLIEAFRRNQNLSDFRVHVIGEGRRRQHWENIARKEKLPFKFYGRLPPDQTAEILGKCSIFAMPSRAEGFALTYLEAISMGNRIIGFKPNVEEIADVMEVNIGRGFDPETDTVEMLADFILEEAGICQRTDLDQLIGISRVCRTRFGKETFHTKYSEFLKQFSSKRI